MPIDELHDPVGYSWWWAVAGLALLGLAVAIVVLIWRRTRVKAQDRVDMPLTLSALDRLRAVHLERFKEIEAAYRQGELDERALHLTLSAQVREYASARLGRDASVLTLTEIRQIQAYQLGPLIEQYYVPSFADYDNPQDLDNNGLDSIDRARALVNGW